MSAKAEGSLLRFFNFDVTSCYHILAEVYIDINMFGPFMVHLIFHQIYCTLAIIENCLFFDDIPNLPTRPQSQIASFTAYVVAIYSVSVVDIAFIDCNVGFQLIVHPSRVKTYPIKDLLLSKSPTFFRIHIR